MDSMREPFEVICYTMQRRSQGKGGPGVPTTPLCEVPFIANNYNLIIHVAKKRESEESTCHKSFLVLGSYILHFQD